MMRTLFSQLIFKSGGTYSLRNKFSTFEKIRQLRTDEETTRHLIANRPISPHLQIYKFPINAIASILTRITGCALVVGISSMGLISVYNPLYVEKIFQEIKKKAFESTCKIYNCISDYLSFLFWIKTFVLGSYCSWIRIGESNKKFKASFYCCFIIFSCFNVFLRLLFFVKKNFFLKMFYKKTIFKKQIIIF